VGTSVALIWWTGKRRSQDGEVAHT